MDFSDGAFDRRLALAAGGGIAALGAGALAYSWLFGDYRTFKDIPADNPGAPVPSGKTGYHLVDALIPKIAAGASGVPVGLLAAWVAKESGGKLSSLTSLDERGYYQLMPAESSSLGLDHKRLSTDGDYSLAAGPLIANKYRATVDALNCAPAGSSLYWLLVKGVHTVGGGQIKKWVKAAQAAGKMGSWSDFRDFVLGQHWTGPQPKKWLPFMESIYKLGRPLGFGTESVALVGTRYVIDRPSDATPRGWRLLGLDTRAGRR